MSGNKSENMFQAYTYKCMCICSAKTPEDVLTELGSTRYLSYMRSTGMTEVLQSGRENITFFVPSDEAFAGERVMRFIL